MIRRAILKAVAIPGYQVPFASREMPLPYGWGTGGVQVTAAIIGPDDVLKVIDQGADDTTNAVSIRAFFAKTADVATTTETTRATIIQTRHRMPETPLTDDQIIVYQVPIPEPLRLLEPRETETRAMHALGEYGVMHVKLYEDIARHGHIATTYAYPVRSPAATSWSPRRSRNSTIPSSTIARRCSCSARDARSVSTRSRPIPACVSLDFEDHPFERTKFDARLRILRRDGIVPRRGRHRRSRAAGCSSAPTPIIARSGSEGVRNATSRGAPRPRRLLRPAARQRFGAIPAATWLRALAGRGAGVVGESGSGKTTLLNLVAGALAPDAGRGALPLARRRVRDLATLTEAERRR